LLSLVILGLVPRIDRQAARRSGRGANRVGLEPMDPRDKPGDDRRTGGIGHVRCGQRRGHCMTSAAIYGCSGHRLKAEERAFYAEAQPWGFILFRRNVDSPEQVKALVSDLRDSVGRDDAPVLIDQEGGRVQRLGPPHWPKYPPGAAYLKATGNVAAARELVRLGARLMAHDLRELGITVDCVPVLDVPVPGAHDIIGDRAYAQDPATVTQLG